MHCSMMVGKTQLMMGKLFYILDKLCLHSLHKNWILIFYFISLMIWRVVLVHCSVGSLIEFWFLSSLTEDLSPTVFSALHCKDIEQRRFQCIAMNCNSLLGNAIQWKAEGERREAAFCVSLEVAARQTLLNGSFCSGQTSQWSESMLSQVPQLTLHKRVNA